MIDTIVATVLLTIGFGFFCVFVVTCPCTSRCSGSVILLLGFVVYLVILGYILHIIMLEEYLKCTVATDNTAIRSICNRFYPGEYLGVIP
jgi:membrane protein YdbS with pleckstrin-like domain